MCYIRGGSAVSASTKALLKIRQFTIALPLDRYNSIIFMAKINSVLISVYDKNGVAELSRALINLGARVLSTGGTLKTLLDDGIPADSVREYTGQEEILGGRVKTLHPRIFGGILARRDDAAHMETLATEGIDAIDVVVVTLYPFEETVAKEGTTLAQAIEQIDIGGVSLLRAAAKNHASTYVVSSPDQYQHVISQLTQYDDHYCQELTELRQTLAVEAFARTAAYDQAIQKYLAGQDSKSGADAEFPQSMATDFVKVQDLRYGENPHQRAAFYKSPGAQETSVATSKQLQGKELSYNNIVDLDSALEVVRAFDEPACCIIKHNNPCGVARAASLAEAFTAARECDPTSAFGGIIGFNGTVDEATAKVVADLFAEAIIAPSFTPEALSVLKSKKNLRLLETGPFTALELQPMLKSVVGGILVQSRDLGMVSRSDLKVVSKRQPNENDYEGLLFAWRVAKFVKSNAIIYTNRNVTIGIGAGQMSRIDSTNIAAVKARMPVRGAYMASDAFFPFRDNVDRAADIGIHAIIQPGGSIRDEEVIAAADEHDMILVFTGMRHFRH